MTTVAPNNSPVIAPHSAQNYAFYSRLDYFSELQKRISQTKPGSRILLLSMTFNPRNEVIAQLMSSLEAAAARGVAVIIGIDAHSFMIDNYQPTGPLVYGNLLAKNMLSIYRDKLAFVYRINQYPSGNAFITNQPPRRFSLPIAGRSHIKIAVIDNTVYVGSHNLEFPDWVNLSLGFENKNTADWLIDKLAQPGHNHTIAKMFYHADQHYDIDVKTELLLDAGVRGQSSIYRAACDMIDQADDWLTITCQYFPNGRTAQHLLQAHQRGVHVKIIYANPKYQGTVGKYGQYISQAIERTRLPAILFAKGLDSKAPMLHAKLIACDKGLLVGSHNYVKAGVKLGTAEIALRSTSPEMAYDSVQVIEANLKQPA